MSSHGKSSSVPTLLPAFEPSSSPSLPRPAKRKHEDSTDYTRANSKSYPTPVPTSSTDLIPSSPSYRQALHLTRPGLLRTSSTVSERVPLSTVPSVELPLNGEPLLMGRSSNSSHYQLSANRLISRVHVSAEYKSPSDLHEHGEVIVECMGWNGVTVHCQGAIYPLGKADTFSSDKPLSEIMLDVQDTRVLIRWPIQTHKDISTISDAIWDPEDSPSRVATPRPDNLASSPPRVHLHSPVSPLPRDRFSANTTFIGMPSLISVDDLPAVQVYEDQASGDELTSSTPNGQHGESSIIDATKDSATSSLSSVEDFSDHDEENDPVVHAFGPFGQNLLPRLASFHTASPDRRRQPLHASVSPRQASVMSVSAPDFPKGTSVSPIRNHIINQLAFSRLHALPLSTIMNNLPASLKASNESRAFTNDDLKWLLDDTACVGEIKREGKDAAGKALQDEFYYLPELDSDEGRKTAIETSKPGMRAVRKQHKQYYWKRPRT